MRHHRDGALVTVCDGCYKPVDHRTTPRTLEIDRTYDWCGDLPCRTKIDSTYPLPHRTPEEVWDSEARAADVGVVHDA